MLVDHHRAAGLSGCLDLIPEDILARVATAAGLALDLKAVVGIEEDERVFRRLALQLLEELATLVGSVRDDR